MAEMKTLTVNGTTYEVVDEAARTASGTVFADGETFQQKYDSGELTGPQGERGKGIQWITRTAGDGSPGTVDTYSIAYTDGYMSTFQVWNGADGEAGPAGYNPVRGTDYWTAADIAEIKSYVDDAILNGAW